MARASADKVQAKRPAFPFGRHRGGDKRRRGGVIATAGDTHQYKSGNKPPVACGNAGYSARGGDTGDSHGYKPGPPDPVGKPAGRKLSEAVGKGECRDDNPCLRVAQLEAVADIRQQGHDEGGKEMMREMRADKKRDPGSGFIG